MDCLLDVSFIHTQKKKSNTKTFISARLLCVFSNVHQHVMEPIVRKSRYADSYVEDEEEEMVMPAVTEPRRDDRRAVQERIKVFLLFFFFCYSKFE